jgi:hypothetical protein
MRHLSYFIVITFFTFTVCSCVESDRPHYPQESLRVDVGESIFSTTGFHIISSTVRRNGAYFELSFLYGADTIMLQKMSFQIFKEGKFSRAFFSMSSGLQSFADTSVTKLLTSILYQTDNSRCYTYNNNLSKSLITTGSDSLYWLAFIFNSDSTTLGLAMKGLNSIDEVTKLIDACDFRGFSPPMNDNSCCEMKCSKPRKLFKLKAPQKSELL